MDVNRVTEAVIGAAIEVHKALGPGLLESVYEPWLAYETYLRLSRLRVGLIINFNAKVLVSGLRRLIWTPPG